MLVYILDVCAFVRLFVWVWRKRYTWYFRFSINFCLLNVYICVLCRCSLFVCLFIYLVLAVIHLWWLKLTSLFSRRWLCWCCRCRCGTPPFRSSFNRTRVIDKEMCATVAKKFFFWVLHSIRFCPLCWFHSCEMLALALFKYLSVSIYWAKSSFIHLYLSKQTYSTVQLKTYIEAT